MKKQRMAELEAEMRKVARGEIPSPDDAALPSVEPCERRRRVGLATELPEEWIKALKESAP
jgi:hypothetical protein